MLITEMLNLIKSTSLYSKLIQGYDSIYYKIFTKPVHTCYMHIPEPQIISWSNINKQSLELHDFEVIVESAFIF